MTYTGYKFITLTDEAIQTFYTNKENFLETYELVENEYIILANSKGEPFFYGVKQDGIVNAVPYPVIYSGLNGDIKPRNMQQYCALNLLLDRHSKVKLLQGIYGSGKDYLMLYAALDAVNKGTFKKIVYVRPPVTVANIPDIGFLPGDMMQKLQWTLGPIYDKVGGDAGIQQLISMEKLEIVPLSYIRGRSFENSLVYMSEGQNTTSEIIKLVLGRIGEGSELWINADTHQVDKRVFEVDNGINILKDALRGDKLFGYVYLPITERSEVARLADKIDQYENLKN